MKTLWNKFIAWLMKDTSKEGIRTLDKKEVEDDFGIKYIAETEGITLAEAARNASNFVQRHNESLGSIKDFEETKTQDEIMRDIINRKKNNTPFYKDDNKKDWE